MISSHFLRILFDLQACQTPGSAHRGVGRYSSALSETVISTNSPHEIYALTSENLPHSYNPQGLRPNRVLRAGALPEWHSKRNYDGGDQDALDNIAISSLCQSIKPDAIHVSHVFEGFSDRIGMFNPLRRCSGQIVSATLYDLIPLLYQDHYFQSPEFRKWYYLRLAWLRKADILLAISESTRQDAIQLLGIEPWRIVTIYGGILDHFRPPLNKDEARKRLRERFSLREKMVLYTGGDDHRKNIKGAIRAFAKIDHALRANANLVIVCAMEPDRKKMYLKEALSHGLSVDDVLITGFVSEEDLIDFYGVCDVFVFPSWYEGLGFPVLEAMACGAPVIGGDNSSIRELIVRKDALFDATKDDSIAECITHVLQDENFATDLREYGSRRSAEFSWQKSADLALEALNDAVARARRSGVQSAVNGWLPCKCLAVLSPLPPCRSGIADYNARFLPYLAHYFEIDLYVEGYAVEDEFLNSSFRIFDVNDFEQAAAAYDLILYEFGNSDFHAHMLPLLNRFPGAVGLHDAYLSGLFGYMDFQVGNTGLYESEMLSSHGPNARKFFAPVNNTHNPVEKSMTNLPCTKSVLDKALGVISHSKFNLDIARENYPEGWSAPYRIIPQMVVLPERATDQEREAIKRELGFKKDDFIIATFGHVAWTKLGDRLLEAFLMSALRGEPRAHLVFAGMLSDDDFGRNLAKTAKSAGLGDRIRITGYLSVADYDKYLKVTNLAGQLRKDSRGGTPKGVLDCLAHEVPVFVNNDASYTDYPDEVVIKLDPDPTTASIAKKIESLFLNPHQLGGYKERGREYVREKHDPSQCAAAYAAALHEFTERNSVCQSSTWVNSFAPLVANATNGKKNAELAARWLTVKTTQSWQRRRVYIDVSYIVANDHKTGIARVVNEILRSLYTSKISGFDPVAVELKNGELFEARKWLQYNGFLALSEVSSSDVKSVEFVSGDVLLMLDSSWARYSEFYPVFERAYCKQVQVITAVYDLLPITLPADCIVSGGREWFESWFQDAVRSSNALLCISRSSAKEVVTYIENNCPDKKELNVGYWHLGSDFGKSQVIDRAEGRVHKFKQKPYLLVIGTIEPRKSHRLILQTMELLWEQGIDLGLCVAGKKGWKVEALMEDMRTHPELGNRFFLIEEPSDDEISEMYQNAAGLLFLSIGEGFGLPLVEAAHHGVPILCTDLPVFKEIAGKYATYVKSDTPKNISREISDWWKLKEAGKVPDTSLMPRLTWEKSSEQLLEVILEDKWFWRKV